jgi:hypothetical protein
MKKIVLTIEDLRVASFETTPEKNGTRGTVRGHDTAICPPTDPPEGTDQVGSCLDTCLVPRTGDRCYLC